MKDHFSELLDALEALEKPETPKRATAKTAKSPSEFSQAPERPTAKTAKSPEDDIGMVACWSKHFGFVAMRDPASGDWVDVQTKDAPGWALGEARRRKELWRDGRRDSYRLTSREMEEIWQSEHPAVEVGIVEEYPPEEE